MGASEAMDASGVTDASDLRDATAGISSCDTGVTYVKAGVTIGTIGA